MVRKLLPLLLACSLPAGLLAQHEHAEGNATQVGKVDFQISCADPVRAPFQRAMALLHSFWYAESEKAFAQVAAQDPQCAMAQWGIAMSLNHPLWEAGDQATLRRGWEAVQKGKAAKAADARERAYLAAIEAFYRDFATASHSARTKAYERAMHDLMNFYPRDDEAKMFYALSLLGTATASPPDKTYAKQRQAGALLEPLLPKYPEHPGLAHYIIHSYDFPPLAERALTAARRYAKIAPDVPHALHMPSHIFTRLGLWDEDIATNLASAAAGHKYNWPGEELHALDYLVYAYLQQGQDAKAKQILDTMPAVKVGEPSAFAGLFARAAIPARFVIERRQWEEAGKLEIPAGLFPGGRYVWTEATFMYARALGAAHTGRFDIAKQAIEKLGEYHQTLLQAGEAGWAEQVEIQRLTAQAWLTFLQGNRGEGVQQMRAVADREDATDKHPVTPGAITPAREWLGEMLLEVKRPSEALREFETVLAGSPGRFHSLYGAGRAAKLAGDTAKARAFFGKLVENCRNADMERAELREARAALAVASR